MQKYDSYKDSGVQWLGEIPSHWEIKRLASYFLERKVKVSDKEYPPLSVTKNGIFHQLENVAKSNDGDNRKLVRVDDFVINSRSDRKGSSGVSKYNGSVSLINIVLEPRKGKVVPDFCNYLLKCSAFIEEFYRNGRGIVADLWTTRYDEMKMIKIPMPSIEEQIAIVTYLDSVTANIDSAIAQQQKMIDLLNERKQIIINNAVTKGLNPDVKMKDSGVDWIGEIPSHWEVCKLKRVVNGFSNGTSATQIAFGTTPYPVTRIETITTGDINYDKVGYVKKDSSLYRYLLKKDDVLISNINSFERVGNCAMYDGQHELYHGMNLLRITPQDNIAPEYLLYSLKSSNYMWQMRKACKPAINQVSVPSSVVKGTIIFMPPLSEQAEIANYCRHSLHCVDVSIENCKNQISLLQERKQIIINEVVTGKVKVS